MSRDSRRGCLRSRSIAHASVVAVVSWPADKQREQLVGDVVVGDRRAVFVARLQHEREHVVALLERRVGPRFGDELGDDLVVAPAIPLDPPPRTPRAEVAPKGRRHHRHSRRERDHRRKQLPQFVERGALRPEHGAQDGVERDAHHRLQRFELPALWPARGLAHHLFFDDRFVADHPLAVKRRDQQLAPRAVLVAVKAERRTRAEHGAEVGRPADEVAARW